ncbi:MAG: Gfo/Idh/MocA family oxidoreductase [Bacteroidetes bacterium]|nr:Gfo/Idh/MocA family oxidoreductase [Bacteroidota bacterium]
MLNIGVFGAGHLGKFHLQNWKEIPGTVIVGFYDPDEQAANEASARFGLKRYESAETLIDEVDAVDIVVPTQTHYALCELAIRKGRHVFVEKPMMETMEQAETMVKLVRESGVRFQVGHVERFNPALLALKHQQMDPMFIEVHRLAEFKPRGTETSVILDLMIHDIDIVLHLVKSSIKAIHASGVAVLTNTPDIANVRIEFNNGCVANLTASRISLKRMRKMRLFQKDAYIGIDFLEKRSEVIRMKAEGDEGLLSFDVQTPQGIRTLAVENPSVVEGNAILHELTAFCDAIRNGTTPTVSELDGFIAMDVAHQILRKLEMNTKPDKG